MIQMDRGTKRSRHNFPIIPRTAASAVVAFGVVALVVGCAHNPGPTPAPSVSTRAADADGSEPEPLTLEAIKELPDDLLERGAAAWVEFKLHNLPGTEEEAVLKLPRSYRMVYTTINVESEIEDGGWNQYFWNTRMMLNREAISDFEMIGADDYADLMHRAVAAGEKEEPDRKRLRRVGTPEAVVKSYDHSHLERFDDEFIGLKKRISLSHIRTNYIREHPGEFVTE